MGVYKKKSAEWLYSAVRWWPNSIWRFLIIKPWKCSKSPRTNGKLTLKYFPNRNWILYVELKPISRSKIWRYRNSDHFQHQTSIIQTCWPKLQLVFTSPLKQSEKGTICGPTAIFHNIRERDLLISSTEYRLFYGNYKNIEKY